MKVVMNGPQSWFFLQNGNEYLLSVRCQNSFVEFETLIQLSPDEYREYHALGRVYIEYLASRVSYWAKDYQSRNLSTKLGAQAHETITEWKAANPGVEV